IGSSAANTLVGNSASNSLKGLAGSDRLEGRAGQDRLSGGAGDDTLVGGEGVDIFAFAKGDGADVITDFVAGKGGERVEVSGYTAWAFVRQQGSDTLVSFGSDSVLLKGVKAGTLATDDFIFI
ncbi:MAG: hypothetical protein ABW128_06450, partial [Rhizorhabdus sp.]